MRITIFIPLTREWRLQRMAEQIAELEVGNHEIDLLVINDNNDILDIDIKTSFRSRCNYPIFVYHTGRGVCNEALRNERRFRIKEVFTKAQALIKHDVELVLTIEDDTEIKPKYMLQLLEDCQRLENVGIVSGVQAGRWGIKMIGVWKLNQEGIESVEFKESGIEEVDATGFYFFITSRELFKAVNIEQNYYQCGPDVDFGIKIKNLGRNNYIDWDIKCGHITPTKNIQVDNNCKKMIYNFKKND